MTASLTTWSSAGLNSVSGWWLAIRQIMFKPSRLISLLCQSKHTTRCCMKIITFSKNSTQVSQYTRYFCSQLLLLCFWSKTKLRNWNVFWIVKYYQSSLERSLRASPSILCGSEHGCQTSALSSIGPADEALARFASSTRLSVTQFMISYT